ncbi:MAG: SDR family oxidoreductase [Deltaproteobacteria bacterium]|nr:SDR family oxidoreductase [Deltaproteobacteria bacterium]
MKVLIPGISTPIARMFAARLAARGDQVVGIDRRGWPDAPANVEVHAVDVRKRAAEDVFRKSRPDVVVHMATVSHFAEATEERYRINLGGTQTVFEHCATYGVGHVVFVGRHTFYGAGPESPLYHVEDEPPLALASFPELADLVAADLHASNALWRAPQMTTTVLRFCYSLGSTGHGTLAGFVRGRRVPTVMGFDPLFQFLHEEDFVSALELAVDKRPRGVFNVAGPPPVPLSIVIRETGRTRVPLPEPVLAAMLGRFGLPRIARGAIEHLKFPVIVDASAFRAATGFAHRIDELTAMHAFRAAFPLGD